MSQSIYLTDPAVAAQYYVHPGEWASIADDVEAAWVVEQHHGYDLAHGGALPAAYFVHPDAPLPFVAYPGAPPPAPSPEPAPPPAGRRTRAAPDPTAEA